MEISSPEANPYMGSGGGGGVTAGGDGKGEKGVGEAHISS